MAFARAVLRATLQDALRLGVVPTNVVGRNRPPKQAPKQVTAFMLDEVEVLLAAADGTRGVNVLRFVAFAGFRHGGAVG